jgi:hypothetical protein
MLLYRSLVVGLLGAIAALVVTLPAELGTRTAPPSSVPAVANLSRSALEKSPAPFGVTLASAVGLSRGEWIVGIDGELVPDRFLQVAISDGHRERQVLVLVRP